MDKQKIKNALTNIFKDVDMIQNGWDGDLDALEATKECIEAVAEEVGVEIELDEDDEDEE